MLMVSERCRIKETSWCLLFHLTTGYAVGICRTDYMYGPQKYFTPVTPFVKPTFSWDMNPWVEESSCSTEVDFPVSVTDLILLLLFYPLLLRAQILIVTYGNSQNSGV